MKPYEIVRDVFIVGGPDITDSRDGCVYLLHLGELVLIDSGAGWSSDKIFHNIEALGFDPLRLKTILLTHCHIDHIGGAPDLRKRCNSKIVIHQLDAPPLEKGDPVLTAATWYRAAFPPTPVDQKIDSSEETLEMGGAKIVCLHTPGHTPGSISIYMDIGGKRVLFGQDLHGPLHAEFGSNLEDWGESTKKLLDLNADILCEGHFGIYKTRQKVKEYIQSYRRHYGVEKKVTDPTLSYQLIRSKKRRKTISLHVKEDGRLVVYSPYRTPEGEIERFLGEKKEWISKKRSEKRKIPRPEGKKFLPGETFFYLGEPYPLEIEDAPGQKSLLRLSFGKFLLNRKVAERAKAVFTDWYQKEAREKLSERVDYYSRRLQLFPKGVKITSARSRWGSCSRDDRLCFSWRLIMAPLIVLDYVLIHELVHIREKNHSKRFWEQLESIIPDYKGHRRWLRDHGSRLSLE